MPKTKSIILTEDNIVEVANATGFSESTIRKVLEKSEDIDGEVTFDITPEGLRKSWKRHAREIMSKRGHGRLG